MQNQNLKSLFNERTKTCAYLSTAWRMVETQEYAATLGLVDSSDEQFRLEQLLDEVKPRYRPGTEKMDFLLKTAFRYPPLRFGSRFGTRLMPSYFYASEEPQTALAETAYYRFLFLQDMQIPYPDQFQSQHCLFSVAVSTKACLDLLDPVFANCQAQLNSPTSYQLSQAVGSWAHQRGDIEVIRFQSARRPLSASPHVNLAIAKSAALASPRPISQQSWLCLTGNQQVSFSSRASDRTYNYTIDLFTRDGVFERVT